MSSKPMSLPSMSSAALAKVIKNDTSLSHLGTYICWKEFRGLVAPGWYMYHVECFWHMYLWDSATKVSNELPVLILTITVQNPIPLPHLSHLPLAWYTHNIFISYSPLHSTKYLLKFFSLILDYPVSQSQRWMLSICFINFNCSLSTK